MAFHYCAGDTILDADFYMIYGPLINVLDYGASVENKQTGF